MRSVPLAMLVVACTACRGRVDVVRAVPPAPLAPGAIRLERDKCGHDALLVPAELDGTLGLFVLDSGAFKNVVFEDFAVKAKLSYIDTGERVGGGFGVPVATVTLDSFAIPGLPDARDAAPARDFVMLGRAASPLARHACGAAGVLAPALLATPDTAIVVDFAAAQLQRVPVAEVEAHLTAAGGARFEARRAETEYTAGIDLAFGPRRLRVMIDTGACCTWVTTTSAVGRAALAHSSPRGNVGRLLGATPSRAARETLRFGDVTRTLDVRLLAPDENDAPETGGLGADALRDCTVAIFETEIRGACR